MHYKPIKFGRLLIFFLGIFTVSFGGGIDEIGNLNSSFLTSEIQGDSGFNLLGWLPFGPSYALALKDSFCFISSGGRIEILLLDSSGNLTKRGEVKARGIITDMVIFENYLYAGLGNRGIEIFDISTPHLPNSLSYYPNEIGDWIFNLEISYPLLFSANNRRLLILDVSNPGAPIELVSMRLAVGIAVMDTFLFIGGPNRLDIYKITNPRSPQLLGVLHLPGSINNHPTALLVGHPYLYVGGFDYNPYYRYYCVVDISEPSNPILIAYTSLFYSIVWDAIIIDSLIYYLNWGSLTAFDIRNPTNPQLVFDALDLGGYRLAIKDSLLIMASGYKIQVLNINDPTSPRLVSQYNIELPPQDFCVTENFAYFGRENELISVDIREPSNPIRVSSLTLPEEISDLTIKDSLLYLTAADSGLRIIDVSDQSNMREIGRWVGSNPLRNIWIRDTLAFITDGDFLILNVSDPTNPVYISSLSTVGNATGLFVQGNYAYVNDWEYGLIIINISNPSSPFIQGSYLRLERTPSSIWGYGSYLYITDNHLLIFDVSNPSSPVLLDSIWSPSLEEFVDIQAKENCLFVVRKTSMFTNYYPFADGINVYALEQPSTPRLIAAYYGPGRSEKIMVGEKIHLLDSKFGYCILELIPIGIAEEELPINAGFFIRARICKSNQVLIEYSLPSSGRTRLRLHDRTGRKVLTLFEGHQEQGLHRLSINDISLSSGIYFAILEFENKRVSSKILLLN